MNSFVAIYTVLFTLVLPLNAGAENAPADVLAAADEGLRAWITNMRDSPERAEKIYGAENITGIDSACLGEPYKLYKVELKDLSVFDERSDFKSLCTFHCYRFPIMMDRTIKAFVSIRFVSSIEGKEEGTWNWTDMRPNDDKIRQYMFYDLKETYGSQDDQVSAFFIHEPSDFYFLINKNNEYYILPASETAAFPCGFDKKDGEWYSPALLKNVLPCLRNHAAYQMRMLEKNLQP